MHSVLEPFIACIETSMIDKERTAFLIHNSRVVTLCHLTIGLEIPFTKCSNKQISSLWTIVRTIVELVAVEDGILARVVEERTIGILASEGAHSVASVCFESSVSDKKIIVVTDVLNVGALTRHIIATCYLSSKVWVAKWVSI